MKLFKVHIVFHLRGKGIKNYVNNKILNRYYKAIFNNVDVICLSELLEDDIAGIINRKPFIIYNGMPIYKINHFDTRKKRTCAKLNILFLSNLIRDKGIIEYIDALKLLSNNNNEFIGTIVGEEADINKEQLIEYITNKELLDIIKYKGKKVDYDKYVEYIMADIFVFPTYYGVEAFPGVILEAMQFGLPIISTREASIPIIIEDGVSGYLVDSRNSVQIAKKLEILINNVEIRKSMGIAGKKKFLKEFTFQIYENNMRDMFNTILTDHQ